jgi:single-strand DNA-binding protein
MTLNEVKVVGNMVSEPEVSFTPKGTPVANISIGINESYMAEDERRTVTTFLDVQVWGPNAEVLGKMVRKGQEIFVQGALRQDRWTDKETGQNRSRLYVKADRWQFTQYRRQEEQNLEATPTPEVDAKETKKGPKKIK